MLGKYWYTFQNFHINLVFVLGPRLIFALYIARINLILVWYKGHATLGGIGGGRPMLKAIGKLHESTPWKVTGTKSYVVGDMALVLTWC
jgi:hypothetical protein